MRRLLLVLAGIALLAVIGFFVAVPIVLHRTLSAEAVERRASEALGRTVTVERARIAFTPALRIRAEGVVIEDGGSADAVEVELAILPLLRRRVEPAELHLARPRLFLHRAPDGRLRSGFHQARRGSEPGFRPKLPPIDAHDGEIVLMEGAAPADAPRLEIRELELGAPSADGNASLRLRVAVAPAAGRRWSLEDARIRGVIVSAGDESRLEAGRLEGTGAVVRGLSIDRFEGQLDFGGGALGVRALSVHAYEGSGEASGRLHLASPARFEGSFEIDGMDAAGIVRDWRGQPLATSPGRLEAQGEVRLHLGGADRGTGGGRLVLADGRLPTGSLFGALLGSLGRLAGRLLSLGETLAPSHSKVERIAATWDLRANRIHTADLEIHTDDYDYQAEGSLGLDKTLDFAGTLQLTSSGVQKLLASAALPLPEAKPVIPAVPLRVEGSLGSPSFSASLTGLPSAATDGLVGIVKGGAGVVSGTARKGKGVLEKALGR